jgi:hypothetical protein
MTKAEQLRKRIRSRLTEQQALIRSLLTLREQLQGSLFARYGVCGKENCACRQGYKHGPYYVLSTRSGGKGGFTYLEREQAARARELVGRHREFQKGLRKLKKLNLEIVALLKRYQTSASRQAQRRFGIEASL